MKSPHTGDMQLGPVTGTPRPVSGLHTGTGATAYGSQRGHAVRTAIRTVLYGGEEMYRTIEFPVPVSTWTVAHNLHQRPNLTLLDTDGNEVHADVDHVDADTIVVTFPYPFAGTAICS